MATLKQNSEALRAITDKLKSLPKRHVLTEVTLTPSKDDVVAVPNEGEAFSKVTVEGDANLKAENIAEGVSIFGVTGTHAGGGGGENKLVQVVDGSITELTASDLQGATKIADFSFRGCSDLTSITIPSSVTLIGAYVCYGLTKLESVIIEGGVTQINQYAFYGCIALKEVVLPEGLVSIENSVLTNIPNLQTITIPSTVTSIGSQAFSKSLDGGTMIMKPSTPPTVSASCLSDVGKILVPIGSGDAYKTATNWSSKASIIEEDAIAGGSADTGNWLFQNEQVDSSGNNSLPAPVIGNSYTLFVDGEEVATSRAESSWDGSAVLRFNTEDYRIYFIYDASTGMGWHFHPMDSQVQSGSVSIRININGGGTND